MSKLPRDVKPQKMISLLKKIGFREVGGKGSHVRLSHPDGRWTQIAVHPKPIPEGTLNAILKQTKLEPKKLKELL